jgi:hypothetical protein
LPRSVLPAFHPDAEITTPSIRPSPAARRTRPALTAAIARVCDHDDNVRARVARHCSAARRTRAWERAYGETLSYAIGRNAYTPAVACGYATAVQHGEADDGASLLAESRTPSIAPRRTEMPRTRIAALAALLALSGATLFASSHREAPLITEDQTMDNTDVYAFRSPDAPETVTIIANYIPLEEASSGPNFYNFSPAGVYEIHIDNNGDGKEDITYQFQFRNDLRNPNTFLYNVGPVLTV